VSLNGNSNEIFLFSTLGEGHTGCPAGSTSGELVVPCVLRRVSRTDVHG